MAEIVTAPADRQMATRWRRRRMCLLDAGAPRPAALEYISGRRARLRCGARPETGSKVMLSHPAAGAIAGTVQSSVADIVELQLAGDEAAIAFALAAIASDMTHD